jgi:hypothetical protein
MQQATQQPGTAARAADGDYKGPLQDGLRHGVGVLRYQVRPVSCSGARAWHLSPCAHTMKHAAEPLLCDVCDVMQIGKSTACYMGQFVRGVRQGLGIITAADGARYEGSFKDNLMWGPGAGSHG